MKRILFIVSGVIIFEAGVFLGNNVTIGEPYGFVKFVNFLILWSIGILLVIQGFLCKSKS